MVKVNAVERLRAELRSPKWDGDHIAMGTNTDPYQHAEGKYHLTRGIVETLSGARNPFSILTKSTLILRDAALLAAALRAHRRRGQLLHRDARSRRLAADRAGHAPARPAGGGPPAPERPRHPLRRPGRPGPARHLGLRSPAARGRRGLRRRPARSPSPVSPCTCGARCAATTSTGSASARPDLVRLHRTRFRRGAYQEDDERERIEGIVRADRSALRCDRARPLSREEAGVGSGPNGGRDSGRVRGRPEERRVERACRGRAAPPALRGGRARGARHAGSGCSLRSLPYAGHAQARMADGPPRRRRRGGGVAQSSVPSSSPPRAVPPAPRGGRAPRTRTTRPTRRTPSSTQPAAS